MPLWVAAIIGGLIEAAGTLVGRVLVSLGIGYVTYTGFDASLAWMRNLVIAQLGWLPPEAAGLASTMKIGVCCSIWMSAISVRLLLQGLTSGSIRRMVGK